MILETYDKLVNHISHCTNSQPLTDSSPVSEAGKTPPRLILISKNTYAANIEYLATQRQHRLFGENRLAALQKKAASLRKCNISWVYIGALQSNKIAKIVNICHEIHSVGSLEHLKRIEAAAQACNKKPYRIFLQVNIACEPQKHGFTADQLRELIQSPLPLTHVHICGLMAMPPKEDALLAQKGIVAKSYRQVASLHQELGMPELSFGMSIDYQLALKLGATTLRIGSAVFGSTDHSLDHASQSFNTR